MFSTTVVRELAEWADCGKDEEIVKSDLAAFSKKAFQSWGQTKIVEDGIQQVGGRIVLNCTVQSQRQWHALAQKEVVALHQRQEVAVASAPGGRR